MENGARLEQLLQCLLQIIARAAIPETRVAVVVGTKAKQLKAFNLSDGTRTQTEIAKQVGVDQASLSRSATRWVDAGIAFRIGDGKDARLLHIYSTSVKPKRKSRATKARKPGPKRR